MATSSMPSAVDALYDLVDAQMRVFDEDVQVLDGPSLDDIGRDIVAIGVSMDDNSTDADLQAAGLETRQETYDLVNMVRSWTGDNDLSARRARAFELFEEVAKVIKANPRLNGTVAYARISSVSYLPSRLPEGAVATVTFRVRVDAFTS